MIEDIHNAYKEHYYIENTHLLDVIYSTYVSSKREGEPLWIVPYAPGSYGKTAMGYVLENLDDVYVIDTLTAKAISTGGLAEEIKSGYSLLYVPDMAGILTTNEEEKKALFSQFRRFYDGRVKRDITQTKDFKSVDIRDINVNMLAFSTPIIAKDMDFCNIIGSRELIYKLPVIENPANMLGIEVPKLQKEDMAEKVKKALLDLNEKPRLEYDDKSWLIAAGNNISMLRVEGITEDEGQLTNFVEKEYPARIFNQLKKLWFGMDMLGVKDKRKIIIEIVKGCGNEVRREIMEYLVNQIWDNDPETKEYHTYSRKEMANLLCISPKEILTQLMVLKQLEIVECDRDIFDKDAVWGAVKS